MRGYWFAPAHPATGPGLLESLRFGLRRLYELRLDAWAEAQKRFHLSDLHIQMARELGLNPKKFGGLANHRQEPWKLPLPEFIAECYRKRFHRERPAQVIPLAEVAKRQQQSARDKVRHPRARTDT